MIVTVPFNWNTIMAGDIHSYTTEQDREDCNLTKSCLMDTCAYL